MLLFKGLIYVKHGRVGSHSEGPDYYLQTAAGDYLLHYQNRMLWQPDYVLEFYQRKMVEITGLLQAPRLIEVKSISETLLAQLASASTDSSPRLDEPVRIELGSKVQFQDGPGLTFLSVLEDSRCPPGAMCIWEGRAVIRMRIEPLNAEPEEFTLTLHAGHPDQAETKVGSFSIALHALESVSQSLAPGQQMQYVATVMVRRA